MSNPLSKLPTRALPKNSTIVPARSKVAVNKSISGLKERKSKISTANVNAGKDDEVNLDKVFSDTLEIAIALLPAVAFMHSKAVRRWISKLMDSNMAKSKRNSYLSFLVFQMQNMKISEPFDKDPPQNISETGKIFTGAKLKAMMEEMETRNLMENLKEALTPYGLANFRAEFKTPAEFFNDQPVPNRGLVAYGGCFSNHFL